MFGWLGGRGSTTINQVGQQNRDSIQAPKKPKIFKINETKPKHMALTKIKPRQPKTLKLEKAAKKNKKPLHLAKLMPDQCLGRY